MTAGICGPQSSAMQSSTSVCIPGLHSRTLPTYETSHAKNSHGTAFACGVPLRVDKVVTCGGCPSCASVPVAAYTVGATQTYFNGCRCQALARSDCGCDNWRHQPRCCTAILELGYACRCGVHGRPSILAQKVPSYLCRCQRRRALHDRWSQREQGTALLYRSRGLLPFLCQRIARADSLQDKGLSFTSETLILECPKLIGMWGETDH